MRIQEELLGVPDWNGGLDARASAVLDALGDAAFSNAFPSDVTIEDADHAIAQMKLQDGNAENLAHVCKIIDKLTPVRSADILFI